GAGGREGGRVPQRPHEGHIQVEGGRVEGTRREPGVGAGRDQDEAAGGPPRVAGVGRDAAAAHGGGTHAAEGQGGRGRVRGAKGFAGRPSGRRGHPSCGGRAR